MSASLSAFVERVEAEYNGIRFISRTVTVRVMDCSGNMHEMTLPAWSDDIRIFEVYSITFDLTKKDKT